MRSFFAFALPVLAAAGALETGAASSRVDGDTSEYFYRESSDSISHIFKLECLGYATREWEQGQPAPTESLLLNFTIPNERGDIYLNGNRILRMPFMPPNIDAVPIDAVPVNTGISPEAMDALLSSLPADLEKTSFFKYGRYELGYSLTQMRVGNGAKTAVQFDVKSIYRRDTQWSLELNHADQKIVQLQIDSVALPGTRPVVMSLSRAELVTREEKLKPFKMKCGREAKWVAELDPREWDNFGKLGTWSRTLNVWWHQQVVPLAAFGFILGLIGLVRFAMRRHAQNAEDIEAAALLDDRADDFPEDAPSEYLGLLPVLPGFAEEK